MTLSLEELSQERRVGDITVSVLTKSKQKLPREIQVTSGYRTVVATIGYWGDNFHGSPHLQKSAISIHGVPWKGGPWDMLYSFEGPTFMGCEHAKVVEFAMNYIKGESCLADLKNFLSVQGKYLSN